mmetsp:Transcript_12581/g.14004  ORF Transcript_12581/g.14004 Transcript_12581/m.14004 type:complete len:134 (+) Transcript_12581:153-554(+)
MCGSCGATGSMVSYYEGDYIEVQYPQKGLLEPIIGKVLSVHNDWGIEIQHFFNDSIKTASTKIMWIDWSPFNCIREYPDFLIQRIDRSNPKVIAFENNSSNAINRRQQEQPQPVTIGHGWLQNPFVLQGSDNE